MKWFALGLVLIGGCASPAHPTEALGKGQDKKKPVYQPFSGSVPLTNWTVTDEAVRLLPLSSAAFAFPLQPASRNYLYADVAASLSQGQTVAFDVTVTGSAPVFTFGPQPANCSMPPMVTPFLWSGNSLSTISERWWAFDWKTTLTLGSFHVEVPLMLANWHDVYGNQDAQAFDASLAKVDHLGLTLGGGCWYGHGVGLSSGSASFTVTRYEVR